MNQIEFKNSRYFYLTMPCGPKHLDATGQVKIKKFNKRKCKRDFLRRCAVTADLEKAL